MYSYVQIRRSNTLPSSEGVGKHSTKSMQNVSEEIEEDQNEDGPDSVSYRVQFNRLALNGRRRK